MIKIYGIDINRLKENNEIEHSCEQLSEERRERIRRVRGMDEKYRCLGAGLLIEYGLRQEGITDIPPVIDKKEHGKPYLKDYPELYFNISHAGSYVLAAFADMEVGIDIERIREYKENVIRKCCTTAEQQWLKKQPDINRAFTGIWTAKESYTKWTGEGLTCDFAQLEVYAQISRMKRNGELQEIALQEGSGSIGYEVCVCAKKIEMPWTIEWVTEV